MRFMIRCSWAAAVCGLAFVALSMHSSPLASAQEAKGAAADILADGEVKIMPPYKNAPELTRKAGVEKGVTKTFTMDRADSKFFPINDKLKNNPKRQVTVYVPHAYVPGTAAAFCVCQDANYKGQMPAILDNLIAEKKLPVIIGIFIANGGFDSKGSERGLEYDTMSGKYAEFIEAEVLPEVEKQANVKLTKDPEGRCAMGGSSGGLAAFTMAWYHPELYHRVVSYSGTFVNTQSPTSAETPHGGWEYHENLIAKSEKKPIRIWMEVGEKDNGAGSDPKGFRNWVYANDKMAEAFKAKGYHYRYVWAGDAKHVDGRVVSQTLPEAMLYVWQGYPIEPVIEKTK